jgi:hypothetical protein
MHMQREFAPGGAIFGKMLVPGAEDFDPHILVPGNGLGEFAHGKEQSAGQPGQRSDSKQYFHVISQMRVPELSGFRDFFKGLLDIRMCMWTVRVGPRFNFFSWSTVWDGT